MKKLLLVFITTFISLNIFGQNGALYQDWYLTSIEFDLKDNITVSTIFPHISPTLTINNELSFSGIAACNNYQGSFSYDEINDLLILENFDATLSLCDFPTHDDFELEYFDFFQAEHFSYSTLWDNEGNEFLDLEASPGYILHYQNHPLDLSINDNDLASITIHPNPSSNHISISSNNIIINSITIYSLTGKKIIENSKGLNSINVSNLSKGMYFIEITSSEGKTVKKFIKN